jgi:hypothetical protein
VVIALLTIEVEYMVVTYASKEVVWLHQVCSWIGFEKKTMKINCDSKSEIFLTKNLAYHFRMKHIYVQYHFTRDIVETKKVLLEKADTLENIANSLTNFVSAMKFS